MFVLVRLRWPNKFYGMPISQGKSPKRRIAQDESPFGAAKPVHPHTWLWETVEQEPTFVLRTMFGTKAVYLHGLMMLCFTASEEPWRGVLVCTDRDRQPALIKEFPSLTPHQVLPKWLYLSESSSDFETTATKLVRLARAKDPRLGVVPNVRKRKKTKTIRRI